MVGGQSKWKVTLDADVWHNVAYEIVRFPRPLYPLNIVVLSNL